MFKFVYIYICLNLGVISSFGENDYVRKSAEWGAEVCIYMYMYVYICIYIYIYIYMYMLGKAQNGVQRNVFSYKYI
jgi:hypothetical protein